MPVGQFVGRVKPTSPREPRGSVGCNLPTRTTAYWLFQNGDWLRVFEVPVPLLKPKRGLARMPRIKPPPCCPVTLDVVPPGAWSSDRTVSGGASSRGARHRPVRLGTVKITDRSSSPSPPTSHRTASVTLTRSAATPWALPPRTPPIAPGCTPGRRPPAPSTRHPPSCTSTHPSST